MYSIFKREGSVGKPVALFRENPAAHRRATIRNLDADPCTVSFLGTHDVGIWKATIPVMGSISITAANNQIDFKEGGAGAQFTATLVTRTYTPGELAASVAQRMTLAGSNTYTVSFDPLTNKFTIASSGGYLSILWNSGTHNATAADAAMGFSADCTGATSYTSPTALGQLPSWAAASTGVFQDASVVVDASNDKIDFNEVATGTVDVDATNDKINFKEATGGVELTATIAHASYASTMTALCAAVKAAMEAAGDDTFTVTYSGGKKFTIASNGTFLSILWTSGTNTATSAAGILGFSTDSTGALSYEGIVVDAPAPPQLTATLVHGAYATQAALALAVKAALDLAGDSTYTVTYSGTLLTFTLASNGSVFRILWASGTHNAVAADTLLGFAADKTGALTYTGVAVDAPEPYISVTSVTLGGYGTADFQLPATYPILKVLPSVGRIELSVLDNENLHDAYEEK